MQNVSIVFYYNTSSFRKLRNIQIHFAIWSLAFSEKKK